MKITEKDGGVLVSGTDINLHKTFDCGQCFRFEETAGNRFEGIAFGRKLLIKSEDAGSFFVSDMKKSEFEERFTGFFDLNRDYKKIREGLAKAGVLPAAMKSGAGIHILRQDFWETLCSFIISQNNNIPRIKKIIKALCALLGEETDEGVFTFPEAEKIACAGVEGIAPIKAGFRAGYIVDAAEKVASGALCRESFCGLSLEEAVKVLCTVKGVGPKVANCVALFSLGYMEAFPIDVWIRRVLDKYYGSDFDPSVFGEYAGLAQQYLFYNERYISDQSPV